MNKLNNFYTDMKKIESEMIEEDKSEFTKVVVEIPDNVQWHIEEYDGLECVVENHRVWK